MVGIVFFDSCQFAEYKGVIDINERIEYRVQKDN